MIQTQNIPNNLFLFNPLHDPFIRGDMPTLPTAMKPSHALRYFFILLILVALPASLIITLLISLTGRNVFVLLPVEIIAAFVACAYIALMGYWHDRALLRSGKVLIGEVIDCDTRPVIGTASHRIVTRMRYRFATPDNTSVVKTVNLAYSRQQLPDGRRYPQVGTKIAVLYADSRHQMLL
ncbi:MAG: hypothetical protein Q9P01_12215 [Anaerolineae bacterium]|nr:hypothetical protein [Anaerolineae bacterium]